MFNCGRKIFGGLIVASMVISTIGCSSKKDNNEASTTIFSGEYNVSGDNLSLDTTVETPPEVVDEITAVPYKINKDKAIRMFVENGKNPEELAGTEYENSYFIDDNGNSITVTDTGLSYYSNFYFYVLNCFRLDPRDERNNADKYSKENNFDFMNQIEAVELVKTTLLDLGADLGDIEYTCYSLDYETMRQEEYAIDAYGYEDSSVYKESWTANDNCYYIAIRQKANNIVEYHEFFSFRNFLDCNASIQAIVTAQGIKYLEMQYAFKFESTGKKLSIKNPQEILDIISDKYGKVISEDKYTIKSFRLCYRTDVYNSYIITPIYECYIVVENEMGITRQQLLIDATSGEEIL